GNNRHSKDLKAHPQPPLRWTCASEPMILDPDGTFSRTRLSRTVRAEERMNLAHCQGNSLPGFLPGEHAHFGSWREHRALHRDRIGVRGDFVWEHQDG